MVAAPLLFDVDDLLDQLDCLGNGPREVTVLAGGLTNTNVRVRTSDADVVVRISSKDSSLLAIDREAEFFNSRAAAEAGAAPAVVEYCPDDHLLVVAYIDGRTVTAEDLGQSVSLASVAAVCRLLHEGPRFVGDFDMFEVQRRYVSTVQERGYRLPTRYLDFAPQVDRIREALDAAPLATVPCNNDLLAANFIDDGERLWVIDFEYAGNNDPCFELGNIWSESNLSLDSLCELVTCYFGREEPSLVARARLLGLMSKYGWTLWASIQDATSEMDFDFWEWGMEKYVRAVGEFDGPQFESLLETAAMTSDHTAAPVAAPEQSKATT
ncbi:MAG: phosphotransferase [Nocardioidaceae bacterium]